MSTSVVMTTCSINIILKLLYFVIENVSTLFLINKILDKTSILKFYAKIMIIVYNFRNPALWSHVIFSILYVIIAGIFMLHYSVRLGKTQEQEVSPVY